MRIASLLVVLMRRRTILDAYDQQVSNFPVELQNRECGLIHLGRQYAENYDNGHHPSGNGVQRVLAELRRLHRRAERDDAKNPANAPEAPSELDALRARRAARG